MNAEPSVSGTQLPAFDRIRAGDVEATIRDLLQRNRAELATLEAQPNPTFDNTVLPLEQLSHRLSRTWSPIGHLNGVFNVRQRNERSVMNVTEQGNRQAGKFPRQIRQRDGLPLDPQPFRLHRSIAAAADRHARQRLHRHADKLPAADAS